MALKYVCDRCNTEFKSRGIINTAVHKDPSNGSVGVHIEITDVIAKKDYCQYCIVDIVNLLLDDRPRAA